MSMEDLSREISAGLVDLYGPREPCEQCTIMLLIGLHLSPNQWKYCPICGRKFSPEVQP